METKFTSKKEKAQVSTEANIEGVNISIHFYGQKVVSANGEQLSSGHVSGDSFVQIPVSDFASLEKFNLKELIDKALIDFKSK